jgi:hypothetical protein
MRPTGDPIASQAPDHSPSLVPTLSTFWAVRLAARIENLVVADIDTDGNLDIAGVVDLGQGTSLLLGVGDGTFKPGIELVS